MGLNSKETPMTTHPIPAAALDDRLGFIGMTGSGKTFGAGTCVERILAQRGHVIIPDPVGPSAVAEAGRARRAGSG